MPAGTITLTNNSTAVTGSGTAFPTELKANDFLVAIVGGTTYTLGVKSVESATALTLTTAYGGPTSGGLAWTPIPNGTLVGITAQIAADTARAIRGLNYDKQNWQQVYSASGNITVTMPDGSTYTGPSWLNLSSALAGKANSNDTRLGTVNGKTGGTISSPVIINATGNISTDFHTRSGGGNGVIASESNAIELNNSASVVGEGGFVNWLTGRWYQGFFQFGCVRSGSTLMDRVQLNVSSGASSGGAASFMFWPDGRGTAQSWVSTSDKHIKKEIQRIQDPLDKMRRIKGCSWVRLDTNATGFGFIAQDVEVDFPDAVKSGSDITLEDGTIIEKAKTVDTYGVSAALHHEAILALMDKIEELESTIKGGTGRGSDNDQQITPISENLHNA